jgi:hypothetical protein
VLITTRELKDLRATMKEPTADHDSVVEPTAEAVGGLDADLNLLDTGHKFRFSPQVTGESLLD